MVYYRRPRQARCGGQAGAGAPARRDVRVLEEKITISESGHDPREQTGEAGKHGGKARRGRTKQLKSCSKILLGRQNLTHLSHQTLLGYQARSEHGFTEL